MDVSTRRAAIASSRGGTSATAGSDFPQWTPPPAPPQQPILPVLKRQKDIGGRFELGAPGVPCLMTRCGALAAAPAHVSPIRRGPAAVRRGPWTVASDCIAPCLNVHSIQTHRDGFKIPVNTLRHP